MKIAFFTGHIAAAPRKASVTLLADSFVAAEHDVRIVTVGYSWLSIVKGDPRRNYARRLKSNRWFSVNARLQGYLRHTLIGPSRLPFAWLNRLTKPFFRWYYSAVPERIMEELRDADAVIVESGPGLLHLPQLRSRLPQATLLYMVCDRLATLRTHPVLMDAEKEYETIFDLITAPSPDIASDYSHPNCHFIPQGVDIKVLDSVTVNPYPRPKNIVSVGDMLFHEEAVSILARENPDWTIHLFGGKARCREALPNIVTHGETPFAEVAPYIKFADIGLAPYRPAPNAKYISQSSLKLKQYTYAHLPILAPLFASGGYDNIISYDPGDLSTLSPALFRALQLDRAAISTGGIKSWNEVMQLYRGLIESAQMSRRN